MQRDLVLTAVVLFVWASVRRADGRMCNSLDIRNDPVSLEKLRNCTVIMGHLHVVLFDHVKDESEFDDYSFPELVEIADYLLLFRIRRLRSIGTLFPNLRVIRGSKLFWNHVLVVYRMSHLQEIGLTNLQHIGRGAIKIDYCPQLCFGNTIDWKAIGASGLDYRKTTNDQVCKNKLCPNECRGHCWNTLHCQALPVLDKCHPQCIGCTKENSSWHCLSCKFFENDGECVEECPQSKVTNYYAMKCMKKEECRTMLNNTWWVFENKCVQSCPLKYERNERDENGCTRVGDNYQKHCNGTVIDTVSILEEMAACTHIDGSLDIRISETYLKPDLETNLGKIVSISGYLKIGRSSAVRSLEFLQNLTLIKGETLENQKYALFVFENQNLQRLWNFTDNFNLTIQRGTIAFHDNPQLCLSEIEKLANLTGIGNKSDIEMFKYSNGDKSACNPKDMNITITENNPTNVTLSWERLESEDNDTVIGYTVYYVEATRGNVTTFANNDACNVETWNSIFVRINSVQLKYLSPYTRYGYYIKAYSTTLDGVQTPIYYFTTASDDPSPPIDFIAQSKNETTIVLSWNSPLSINGKLSYYNITMYFQKDYESLIEQRNYCLYPHTESEEDMEGQLKIKTNAATSNCSCLDQDDFRIFNKDNLCLALGGNCKSFLYNTETQTDDTSVQKVSIHKRTPVENVITISGTNQTFRQIVKTDIDMNMYEFTNLRHFSVYIFFLMACNEREGTREQCSAPEMVSQRTNRSETADIVDEFHIKVDGRNAYITWFEPQEINSLIVSYQVEHKRIDLEHAKATTECLTRRQYQQMNHRYQLFGLVPGRYAVRVRAVSLAGPGKLSERKYFEIAAPKTGIYWIYALVALVAFMIVTLAAYIGRYCYRKKYALDRNHLITSINPDYAGPIYEEDEWEIDRSDIEIIKELGQGSFGMVYQGMIRSRRYPCAIKTVNDSATMPSRMEFLNEGAVMKSFNDGHHVIKLLGIVSRGQPPLVVMELMERGDLKSYLRRCREPSQNLTTNEIYRMAVEIADGMAYLAAKKFVHRDLAARNCMVAADRTVKIGDFGMARDIYETDYYRKETVGLLPVRWMAPESLADGVFTSDSDVWSYGIVLWEMATLAEQPYQGLSNEEVFHFVKNRGKLDRPSECSDLLYEVMDACWLWRPNDRPTFADIVDKLANHVGQDFRLVAFCYSRQGRELALNAGPRVYNPPAMIVAPEEDFFGRYDASEEEVSLYVKEPNRPTKFLPLSSQRYNKSSPYQISPGSPSSTFSLNSS